jgi:hypothetical protein
MGPLAIGCRYRWLPPVLPLAPLPLCAPELPLWAPELPLCPPEPVV